MAVDHRWVQVFSASRPELIHPFTGVRPAQFHRLVRLVAKRGGDVIADGRPGGPWALNLPDRVLLVAVYWRTNLTMRQLGPLFGVSHSAAHRVIDTVGPLLALTPVRRRAKEQVAIVDGTLIPTRDHRLAAQSKNYRYSTNLQVAIDANTRLIIALGDPQPGNRNDTIVYRSSGINDHLAGRAVIADGGYRGNHEVIMPYRKPRDGSELVETGLQRRTPQGQGSRRTCPGPAQDLQDPSRLPSRCRNPRCHRRRNRPPAQHRSGRLTPEPFTANACTQLRDIA